MYSPYVIFFRFGDIKEIVLHDYVRKSPYFAFIKFTSYQSKIEALKMDHKVSWIDNKTKIYEKCMYDTVLFLIIRFQLGKIIYMLKNENRKVTNFHGMNWMRRLTSRRSLLFTYFEKWSWKITCKQNYFIFMIWYKIYFPDMYIHIP